MARRPDGFDVNLFTQSTDKMIEIDLGLSPYESLMLGNFFESVPIARRTNEFKHKCFAAGAFKAFLISRGWLAGDIVEVTEVPKGCAEFAIGGKQHEGAWLSLTTVWLEVISPDKPAR